MRLENPLLKVFVDKIKLRHDQMPIYREQVNNLKERLGKKVREDERTGMKVSKFLLAGSWKKRTILRPTGENPIDIDLILFVEGDDNLENDLEGLHDFVVGYLGEIYPTKDIDRDVDAEGKTKSIKIKFTATGLELDIVPVIPIEELDDYVWQPQRGGGGKKYITSITKQLEFSRLKKEQNASFTSIVRCIKWWRNYAELRPQDETPGLSSFVIEIVNSYLEIIEGIEENIEAGIIRFFRFISDPYFPNISFNNALSNVPTRFDSEIYIADPVNNDNNVAKKIDSNVWKEITNKASVAFDSLCIAQSKKTLTETTEEWKSVFGPSFNISI